MSYMKATNPDFTPEQAEVAREVCKVESHEFGVHKKKVMCLRCGLIYPKPEMSDFVEVTGKFRGKNIAGVNYFGYAKALEDYNSELERLLLK